LIYTPNKSHHQQQLKSTAMSDPSPSTNGAPSPHNEKLLEAANSASQTVAALHVAFMAFAAYLGVIVWGTSHEDLLRISPVKLPILGVELPLTTFYGFVPWLVVLLHFNLLMQLELLSRKLWNLDRDLPDTSAGQQIRDRLFIFPFTHLIAGRSSVRLIRWLLSLTVGLTIIVLPLFMLLAAQIRFLPFHDEAITWSQRFAVWFDAVMLLALWPLIASPNDDWWEWWRSLRFRLFDYRLAWLLYWGTNGWNRLARLIQRRWPRLSWREICPRPMPQTGAETKRLFLLLISTSVVMLFSIVAVIPGSITVQTYYDGPPKEEAEDTSRYFEDWLIRHMPEAWLSVVDDEENTLTCTSLALERELARKLALLGVAQKPEDARQQVMLGLTCSLFDLGFSPRNLNLKEARLVPYEVSLSLLTRAIDQDKPLRNAAFKEFDGLKLQKRDLRFADLSEAVMPKADLRHVRLQGAHLDSVQLQGTDLKNAELQAVDLGWANLQGADLREANLLGANMDKANLQGAVLSGANLFGANLDKANLQGAVLSGQNMLQGADLGKVNQQGAVLDGANLSGASLSGANLQSADLTLTNLQGADLYEAKLQGAVMSMVNLQGAYLDKANLQGAVLSGADLSGASLREANLQGATMIEVELQGVNWSSAILDGLYIVESLEPYWSEDYQSKLEATIKPLLNKEELAAFQKRMERARENVPLGDPASKTGCYSEDPALLKCKFRQPAQLDAYRTVLHSALIELACSNAAIAEGIARLDYVESTNDYHVFGLTAALLKAMDTPKPCVGLAALSEQARKNLREIAEQQKKKAKPK
jgi:uncharacterized protein YjbI with pentapeptide repeats